MIVKECQPFEIIKDVEFQTFIKFLCSGYSFLRHNTISHSLIPQVYESTVQTLKSSTNEVSAVC